MQKDFCIISFASGEPYLSESKQLESLCNESSLTFKLYESTWLKKTKFYTKNKKLLDSKKSGYCAWKPFIILDALKEYKKILYLDSSMLFNKENIHKFIGSSHSILSTETTLINKHHTKYKTFEIMGCNSDKYFNCKQVWAGVILADRRAKHFLKRWLHYCCIEDCISDEFYKSIEPDVKYVLYDQSIYSTLYKKYNKPYISNVIVDKYDNYLGFYFGDTRERSHRDTISKIFGRHIMENQDDLIKNYFEDYMTNGSCCYNPLKCS